MKGCYRWLETNAVPLFDKEGNVESLLGITRDITEHYMTEEALKESEERLSSFMNPATDHFYLLDSDLNFIAINKQVLDFLNLNEEDIIGKNISEIVPDIKSFGNMTNILK